MFGLTSVDVSEPVEAPAATAALPVPGADVKREEVSLPPSRALECHMSSSGVSHAQPVVKSSPSTPKMHRRISARIGQYIDTRFGDKKEKPISAKKDTPVVDEVDATPGTEAKVDETPVVKIDEAPVVGLQPSGR